MNPPRSFGNTNVWARRVFGRGLAGNGNWTRTRGLRGPPSSATSGPVASVRPSRTRRGGRGVLAPGLAPLPRADPGRAGAVPVRPLLGHLDPPFRFEGLEDPIDRGILDPEEPAHLLGRRDPVPKEAEGRGRLLPREAEGLQGPRRLLLPHRGCLRGLARKGFPAFSSSR